MGKDEESALKFTIDGEEVEYIRGQTILEAAENAGIYIPNLCVIKELSPFGACRLCTVKIVGARKPFVTACSTPAIQNIEVINNSEELQEMRSDIIQMMLSEHPNACLICGHNSVCPDYNSDSKEKAGRIFGCFSCPSKNICQLKSVVKSLDITKLKYDYEYKDLSFENEDPFFDRDYNLCVLCGRCVRVCNELRGIGAIHFMNRGHDTKVSTAGDLMQKESNCIFCGSCVDTCPTGALSLKTNKWIKREECNYIESICGICSLCCDFDYYVSQNGEFESIPKTQACIIGRFCTSKFNNHKDRLKEPLMKKYGKLAPVKWEEAYEKILENFKKFKPNEIAFLVSTDLSNESAYMINDFVLNKLKSDNIGIISDEDSIDLFKKLQVIPHSISKIEISEYILLINANPQISHPNLLINLNKAKNIGSNIISLNFDNISIPNETSAILDEEEYLSENEIIKKIEDFEDKKNVTIILGNQYSTKIVNSILDLASKSKEINLIQLKCRTNFEGVMTIIPKSEEKIIQAIDDGEIKALYLTERIDKKYLKNLEYLVIQDIFPSDNFEFADIILPVCSFLEDSGTILDIELKEKKFNKCIPCSGDQKPDWQIFLDLIEKLEEIKPKISGIQDLITLVNKKYPINFSSVKESPSLLSSVDSKIYGRPVFSNYFQYRGEKISNKVKEFMNLVEYRENIKKKSKTKSIKNKKKGIDIEIDINGNVIIGSKIYGLNAILPIIKVIKSSGNDVNIILEPFNNNLLYLQQERFCLCNNYKKNLSKAQVLIELKEDLCKTYIRTKSKSKKLEPIGGVVLIKREFVETNDKFIPTGNENLFDNDDALDPGMLRRAIAACQSIIRSSDLIINKSNTNSVESESDKKKSSLVWDIWHYQRQNSGKGNDLIKAKIYNAISDKLDAYSLRDDFPDYLYYIIVHIDEERCIGCGNCIKICPHEAISFNHDNKKYIFGDRKIQKAEINPLKCYNCAACLSECPVNAISINKWNERPFFAIIEDIAEKAFEKE